MTRKFSVIWENTENGYTQEVDSDLSWADARSVYMYEKDSHPDGYTNGVRYDRLAICNVGKDDDISYSLTKDFK